MADHTIGGALKLTMHLGAEGCGRFNILEVKCGYYFLVEFRVNNNVDHTSYYTLHTIFI